MQTRQGDRSAYGGVPGVAPMNPGTQAGFNIDRNSTGARLSGYIFRDFKAVVRQESASASIADPQVSDVEVYNCERFWETTEGQETFNASCRNARVVGFERAGVRWFSVKGGLIEDCYFEGNQGGLSIVGVQLENQCADVTIRRVTVKNLFDKTNASPTYNQGDGIAVEGGQPRIVLQDISAIGTADGGYDLKATDMDLLGTLYAEDNGRGFRFHRGCRASTATLTIKGARGRAIWWNGQNAQYPDPVDMDIGKVVLLAPNGANSAFRFESGPATVRIWALDVAKEWRGKLLQENGGSGYGAATFPNGCRVQQDDDSWITYPGAPPTSGGLIL